MIGVDLVFGCTYIQFSEICSLPQGTICGNMCKVDHQVLPYVKVLSETRLFLISTIWCNMLVAKIGHFNVDVNNCDYQ